VCVCVCVCVCSFVRTDVYLQSMNIKAYGVCQVTRSVIYSLEVHISTRPRRRCCSFKAQEQLSLPFAFILDIHMSRISLWECMQDNMKANKGKEIKLFLLLTSFVGGGECIDDAPAALVRGMSLRCSLCRRLSGPRNWSLYVAASRVIHARPGIEHSLSSASLFSNVF